MNYQIRYMLTSVKQNYNYYISGIKAFNLV